MRAGLFVSLFTTVSQYLTYSRHSTFVEWMNYMSECMLAAYMGYSCNSSWIAFPAYGRGLVLISLGYIPGSGIVGSYGNSMFDILKNFWTAFQSSCTILYSHQQSVRVQIYPHPCQYILPSVILITAIPVGMKSYLIVVLICISLWTDIC